MSPNMLNTYVAEDTTMLLCNRMNHPSAEMHEFFARKLFELIIKE